jgi:enterochelin esterase family protein
VLVLLPGTPGVETDWTTGGGAADVVFDNLIAEGKMAPAVVLMHATDVLPRGRRVEHLGAFEPMLVNELLPALEARYRVSRRPADGAIAGLSLGGEFALTVGLRHPELFRTVASFSGSLTEQDFEDRFGKALANPVRLRRDYRLIWFACGTDDLFFPGNQAFAARLATAGVPHTFRPVPGGHVQPSFRRQLVELLPLLFR